MLLELSTLLGSAVRLPSDTVVGSLDMAVIDGKELKLKGFQVAQSGLIKRFAGLAFDDVAELNHLGAIVERPELLQRNLKSLDDYYRDYGAVINVVAKTESGERLGRVQDLLIDAETGLIVRFYLRNILKEQIVPRQFVVSVTPRAVVFKDVVAEPIFDQVALGEAKA